MGRQILAGAFTVLGEHCVQVALTSAASAQVPCETARELHANIKHPSQNSSRRLRARVVLSPCPLRASLAPWIGSTSAAQAVLPQTLPCASETLRPRAHLLVLGGERLVGQVELDAALLVGGELHEDVRVVGLALADGRVQRHHDQRVRRVALGQHEQAHDAVVLDAVVLRLRRRTRDTRGQRQTLILGSLNRRTMLSYWMR